MARSTARFLARLFLILGFSGVHHVAGQPYPSFRYQVARTHELLPHRRSIPLAGVDSHMHQLRLKLTVSVDGQVLDATPNVEAIRAATPTAEAARELLDYWPKVRDEVLAWRFVPFETNGTAVVAEIEEYLVLSPAERLPTRHVIPPELSAQSSIAISLERRSCFGACAAYTAFLSWNGNSEFADVQFEGRANVIAPGIHHSTVQVEELRRLAKRFIDADFYSMDDDYRWSATDLPAYVLSVSIDGRDKHVTDYAGQQVGMPEVITALEDDVDRVAETRLWIKGEDGLVALLQRENFDFKSVNAQLILKEAVKRGKTAIVKQLLAIGVPLTPYPSSHYGNPFADVGWLDASSGDPDILKAMMQAGASRDNELDRDVALSKAANSGSIESVKALIGYGANPNADFRKIVASASVEKTLLQNVGPGIILNYGASSGNAEVVKELLRYHPNLEEEDREGRTPLLAAAVEHRDTDRVGARAEIVRLLVAAGANVNVRDRRGNTPLHGAFDLDVALELLKLGVDVNAKNSAGETPLFTIPNVDGIAPLLEHGADPNIRSAAGDTAMTAATKKGSPLRQTALAKAMANASRK
jgi:ankyrin repeat protein